MDVKLHMLTLIDSRQFYLLCSFAQKPHAHARPNLFFLAAIINFSMQVYLHDTIGHVRAIFTQAHVILMDEIRLEQTGR